VRTLVYARPSYGHGIAPPGRRSLTSGGDYPIKLLSSVNKENTPATKTIGIKNSDTPESCLSPFSGAVILVTFKFMSGDYGDPDVSAK
jgi:hypothetical protein